MKRASSMNATRNRQSGATAVELAFMLPFLALLLLAAVHFGILMYNQAIITDAAREGARAGVTAAVKSLPPDPVTFAQNAAASYDKYLIDFSTPAPPPGCATNPCTIVSGTAYTYPNPMAVEVRYSYAGLRLGAQPFGVLSAKMVMFHE